MNSPSDKKKKKGSSPTLSQGALPAAVAQLPMPPTPQKKAYPLRVKVDFHCSPQAGIFISVRTLNHHISSDAFLCLQLTSSQESENPGATAQGMKVACSEN